MSDGQADAKENAATTMDRDEKYFELLLSEKQHADSAIGGHADLHVKLFGFFGVGITCLDGYTRSRGRPTTPVSWPSHSE
jgi:hypothetical protein